MIVTIIKLAETNKKCKKCEVHKIKFVYQSRR